MYNVFDSYLGVETWHTGHDYDSQRFHISLNRVVRDAAFNADSMGEYMRAQKCVSRDNPDHAAFNSAIDKRVADAWAVSDFISFNVA
jgi:hypothetical protein